mmetsp:Transcript_60224/g.173768  ORF Transcript_60224/g.173768 Transcript_60224/m.173768 type:complete len:951 (+) Transcript_60224:76-2928(+)|eukprot:CAMPEP_0176044120 /NCGR_PEP_ID=MMETSP0120_2-20121206/21897_1 /TAXON_ID=160619 /ORGANISM="Kryptoperidinium foliaceum, Strain CCMP 1326" /LENGTH=950 /DNA_ID=CAMNT_0017377527 /DNA_START=40 /DNA_END=2892 /DNA_ORIENTATION=+
MAAASSSSHSRGDEQPFSIEEGQKLVIESLSGLGQLAGEFCCILSQPELSCAAVNSLGFMKCVTSAHFSTDFWANKPVQSEIKGLLITQVGLRIDERSLEIARSLSRNANVPSILVVVIAPLNRTPVEHNPSALAKLSSVQHRAQEAFISSGADDVVMLDLHEPLSGHRVCEAVHRIEILARRLSQEIDSIQAQATKRVEEVKELASRKLQVAWRNQMWTLPGAVLECIPAEDQSISEWPAREEGGLGGVGGYAFEAKLGGGSFGTVFKAQHKDYGTVAVKVIQKSGVKNVSQLFSLNQELGIMQHMPRHQNATAAMTSFHTSNCIYLVMEYAGSMSLHKFVRSTLAAEGSQALPRDLARSFCVQMAVALSHLHSLMVCHRDLKPANFIVSDQGNVLSLVDFGFAVMLCSKEQRLSACCGSLPFCAPEVLRASAGGGRTYDPFAADIWSLSLNFVEMACGPYSIEKCLGWVPQHPSDPEKRKRDVERLEGLWAKTPETGIEGLGNTVSHMLLLQADKRWTIVQVLGNDGLGVGLVASPPGRRSRTVKVPQRDFSQNSVQSRPVDLLEEQKGDTTSLLERLGGPATVRAAIEKMFDTAISATVVGILLGRSAASIPALRSVYVEEVTAFFETVPGQGIEQTVMNRLGDAHRPWDFSDAMFDSLVEHFSQALTGFGMRPEVVHEAVKRFRALRVKVTAGYRAGCTFARKQNTAAWRSKLRGELDCLEQATGFATLLAGALSRHPSFGTRVPQDLRSPESIQGTLLAYLQSEAKVPSPVMLQVPSLSMVELGELMDTARQALVESCWGPDEVLLLQFAMSDEWDHIRLTRALGDLAHHSRNLDRVAWTSFSLRLQMAFTASPSNRTVCENPSLPMCLARICEVLATRACEDPWQLSFGSCGLSISDAHFDSLVDQVPGACSELQPVVAQKVVAAMQAMRAFVVQGCANTARAG